ncbi:MAG TPA: hypothetical protein VMU17_05175, partial [Elusimicrobiota bacterium]|nr:hypothetical protein [Elusimicrobiota bacterium]
DVRRRVPPGWALVRRPTGGGIVFHHQDLCVSLAWRHGQAPLPAKAKDQYAWIHGVIQEALANLQPLRLAGCADVRPSNSAFHERTCFTHPAGYDVLSADGRKLVGGALALRRNATLYQGSIQGFGRNIEPLVADAFRRRFAA